MQAVEKDLLRYSSCMHMQGETHCWLPQPFTFSLHGDHFGKHKPVHKRRLGQNLGCERIVTFRFSTNNGQTKTVFDPSFIGLLQLQMNMLG